MSSWTAIPLAMIVAFAVASAAIFRRRSRRRTAEARRIVLRGLLVFGSSSALGAGILAALAALFLPPIVAAFSGAAVALSLLFYLLPSSAIGAPLDRALLELESAGQDGAAKNAAYQAVRAALESLSKDEDPAVSANLPTW